MRRLHLLPIASFLILALAVILITQYNIYLDPLLIGAAVISYVCINVIWRLIRKTLVVGYIVEYSLIALIVYFILIRYN